MTEVNQINRGDEAHNYVIKGDQQVNYKQGGEVLVYQVAGREGPQGPQGEQGPPGEAGTSDTALRAEVAGITADLVAVDVALDARIDALESQPAGDDTLRAEVGVVTAGLVATDVYLQTQITTLSGSVGGATVSLVASVSAALSGAINAEAGIRAAADSAEAAARAAADALLTPLSTTAATSASLKSYTDSASGSLAASIAGEAAARAAADALLSSRIDAITGSYATVSYVQTVSANLSTAIAGISATGGDPTLRAEVGVVTGALQAQINNAAVDSSVVHKTGTEHISGFKFFDNEEVGVGRSLHYFDRPNGPFTDAGIVLGYFNPSPGTSSIHFSTSGTSAANVGIREVTLEAKNDTQEFLIVNRYANPIRLESDAGVNITGGALLVNGSPVTTNATVAAVSAGLDSRITTNTSAISNIQTWDSQLAAVTGGWTTTSYVANLTGQLTAALGSEASQRVSADATEAGTRAAADSALSSRIDAITAGYATTAYVGTVSGNLSTAVAGEASARAAADALLTPLATTRTISGQLQSTKTDLTVTASISAYQEAQFDFFYEHVTNKIFNDHYSAGLELDPKPVAFWTIDGFGTMEPTLSASPDLRYDPDTGRMQAGGYDLARLDEIPTPEEFPIWFDTIKISANDPADPDTPNTPYWMEMTADGLKSQDMRNADGFVINHTMDISAQAVRFKMYNGVLEDSDPTDYIEINEFGIYPKDGEKALGDGGYYWKSAAIIDGYITTVHAGSIPGFVDTAWLASISGSLAAVDATKTPLTTTAAISAGLDSRISSNTTAISNIQTWDAQLAAVSGSWITSAAVASISAGLAAVDATKTDLTVTAAISAGLDSRITTNATDIATLRNDTVAVSAGLDARITNNANEIANIQIWDAELAAVSGSWITSAAVASLSGQLTPLATTAETSAYLYATIAATSGQSTLPANISGQDFTAFVTDYYTRVSPQTIRTKRFSTDTYAPLNMIQSDLNVVTNGGTVTIRDDNILTSNRSGVLGNEANPWLKVYTRGISSTYAQFDSMTVGATAWSNDPTIILSGLNYKKKTLEFDSDGLKRWEIQVTDNETGGNVGGNLYFKTYNDSGLTMDTPVSVERVSGGWVNVSRALKVTGAANISGALAVGGAITSNGTAVSLEGHTHAGTSPIPISGSYTQATTGVTGINFTGSVNVSASSGLVTVQIPDARGDMLSVLSYSEVSITGATTLDFNAFGKMHVINTGVTGVSAGNYTVILPTAVGHTGEFVGIRISSSAQNVFTIQGNGGEFIGSKYGTATTDVMWANEVSIFKSNGTGWDEFVINRVPMRCYLWKDNAQSTSSNVRAKITFNNCKYAEPAYMNDVLHNQILIPRAGNWSLYQTWTNSSGTNPQHAVYKNDFSVDANVLNYAAGLASLPNSGTAKLSKEEYVQGAVTITNAGAIYVESGHDWICFLLVTEVT